MISYNDTYDLLLTKLVSDHPRSYFKTIKSKSNRYLLEYIELCTPLLDGYNISTRTYWTIHHIQEFPKCKCCGKELKQDIKINDGYPTHCSQKCVMSDEEITNDRINSLQCKYGTGITNPFQSQDVKKKIEETNIQKYGHKRFTQSDKYKSMMSDVYYDTYKISQKDNLVIKFDRKKIYNEIEYYKNTVADKIFPTNSRNFTIKYFQQDAFFKKENELWRNNTDIRYKLIENRIKYLNKQENELTDLELLSGFKKSAIYYGYSHFNPLWFKYFITKYGIKRCYDPCGGWGHRLLGSFDLEKYIYNDLSHTTKSNVDRIIEYLDMKNVKTYSNDARNFIPDEDFDAMFTCPPYFNLEEYECGKFSDQNDFKSFIDSLFLIFHSKETCKIFGLVIREDMIFDHDDYVDKIPLEVKKSDHLVSIKHKSEYIYVYKKT